ncbi:hypothetical protein HJG60_008099 [Phyllostomus discolor]|uniref:Uncharacterized protein n=1 Tax=Phyllostomus discolor TaxID=89673 RepID=A0A834EW01_9CHIR|nr:hypothetical protein HJG60_008099 [Phyllostomus discolor]
MRRRLGGRRTPKDPDAERLGARQGEQGTGSGGEPRGHGSDPRHRCTRPRPDRRPDWKGLPVPSASVGAGPPVRRESGVSRQGSTVPKAKPIRAEPGKSWKPGVGEGEGGRAGRPEGRDGLHDKPGRSGGVLIMHLTRCSDELET